LYFEFKEAEFFKQQEVMKALVIAVENSELNSKLRTYSLYKNPQVFGYGIAFHTEPIQPSEPSHRLVYPKIEIEQGSSAEDAGMRFGQRVVAVNGEFINKELKTLEDVVQAIEDSYYSRNFTDITVIEPELWEEFMENLKLAQLLALRVENEQTQSQILPLSNIDTSLSEQGPIQTSTLLQPHQTARLCRLVRSNPTDQYGFDFKTLKNEGKHVANNVRFGYPADLAGLRNGDLIIEVNKQPVDGVEHEIVVNMISKNPTSVDLLVVSDLNDFSNKSSLEFNQNQTEIELTIPPYPPNKEIEYYQVNLLPGQKGIGLGLAPNGIINSIEPNSAADRAGLRKGLKIVQVNGVDVSQNTYQEIGKLIKKNEKDLVIGAIDIDRAKSASSEFEHPSIIQNNVKKASSSQVLYQPEDAQVISVTNLGQESSLASSSTPKISGWYSYLQF
jgi:membrane-associated protease RseP (regulator of RpoE activity)